MLSRTRIFSDWNDEKEARAATICCVECYVSAEQPGYEAAYVQTDSRPGSRRVEFDEASENNFFAAGRNAAAGVCDRESDSAGIAVDVVVESHSAFFGELACVR